MLEEVLVLFMQRYGLTEPDDSAGVAAIQGAMRGSVTIAALRGVLTEQYDLYPHYEERVLTILRDIDEASTGGTDAATVVVPEPETATGSESLPEETHAGAESVVSAADEAPAVVPRTRGGRQKTK